jgi:hypothetical protein
MDEHGERDERQAPEPVVDQLSASAIAASDCASSVVNARFSLQ